MALLTAADCCFRSLFFSASKVCFCLDVRRCFLGAACTRPASLTSCLLNSSLSSAVGPWLVDVDGELEGGAQRDEMECREVGSCPITSCLGAEPPVELTETVDVLSRPVTRTFLELRHALFFLDSSLCGDFKFTSFIAVAVEKRPSDAANTCATIRSFCSTESTGHFFGGILTLGNSVGSRKCVQ